MKMLICSISSALAFLAIAGLLNQGLHWAFLTSAVVAFLAAAVVGSTVSSLWTSDPKGSGSPDDYPDRYC